MASEWDRLPTIRVVDAGFLLAGMEPQRKWQFAPPLVKNFYSQIKAETGAVTLATLPGERMEITQSEFKALKAKYGVAQRQDESQEDETHSTSGPWPNVLHGQRVWKLSEAIDDIAHALAWDKSQRDHLMAQATRDASAGDLVLRDLYAGGIVKRGDRMSEMLDYTFSKDMNAWLDRIGAPFPYRLPEAELVPVDQPSSTTHDPAPVPSSTDALPMTRSGLIKAHKNNWATIEGDLKDASVNGLSDAAKVGQRGWSEEAALNWARAKGKLRTSPSTSTDLAQATHNMVNLPGRKHKLER